MIRVAIVGARRRNAGLGEFLTRFFRELGAEVAGVVGRSEASARETADHLSAKYGITTRGFGSLLDLFARAGPVDAVAICSPHEAHLEHLRQCAQAGVHTLCEKPLVWGAGLDLERETRQVAEAFRAQGKLLMLNAQWPQILATFRRLHPGVDPGRMTRFEMGMCPPGEGLSMIPEAVPHAISLLLALLGPGEAGEIRAAYPDPSSREALTLTFRYAGLRGAADCRLVYRQSLAVPRPTYIAVDGARIDRVVKMPGYEVGFTNGKQTLWIEDPLKAHVRDFLEAIRSGKSRTDEEGLLCHSRILAQFRSAVPV